MIKICGFTIIKQSTESMNLRYFQIHNSSALFLWVIKYLALLSEIQAGNQEKEYRKINGWLDKKRP